MMHIKVTATYVMGKKLFRPSADFVEFIWSAEQRWILESYLI